MSRSGSKRIEDRVRYRKNPSACPFRWRRRRQRKKNEAVLRTRRAMETKQGDGLGFRFDHVRRNAYLSERGIRPLKTLKTGTTIAGVIYKVCSWVFRTAKDTNETKRTDFDRDHFLETYPTLLTFQLLLVVTGWRDPRCGYEIHGRVHRSGQELRKDSSHRSEHLLLRCGNGSRYRSSDR